MPFLSKRRGATWSVKSCCAQDEVMCGITGTRFAMLWFETLYACRSTEQLVNRSMNATAQKQRARGPAMAPSCHAARMRRLRDCVVYYVAGETHVANLVSREPADLSASRSAHPKLRAAGVKPRWCEPWGTQAKRSAALLPPPHIQASPTTSSLIFDASWDVDKKLND